VLDELERIHAASISCPAGWPSNVARGGGSALTPVKVGLCAFRLGEEKPAVQTERWAMGTYVMFTRLSHDAFAGGKRA
jgi:hypothetical protein